MASSAPAVSAGMRTDLLVSAAAVAAMEGTEAAAMGLEGTRVELSRSMASSPGIYLQQSAAEVTRLRPAPLDT
jgi:hypothetical protein